MSNEAVDALEGIRWNLTGLDSEIGEVVREIRRQTVAQLAMAMLTQREMCDEYVGLEQYWDWAIRRAGEVYGKIEDVVK